MSKTVYRSYDSSILIKATECCRDLISIPDCHEIVNRPKNILLVSGQNVGLAIYDYPGVYTVHWYYSSRGRVAINLAQQMLGALFENYGIYTVRGLIKTKLKASRWATRKVGLKSYGFIMFPDNDENEIFILTKAEYQQMKRNNLWAQ